MSLPPGTYDVRVRADGVVAINVEGQDLDAGSITTLVARNPDPEEGEDEFGFIVLPN